MNFRGMKILSPRVIAVTAVVGFIGIAGLWHWTFPPYERLNFDREGWLAANENMRGKMVDDLIEKRILDGMSRVQLIDFLGMPQHSEKESIEYWLASTGQRYGTRSLRISFRVERNIGHSDVVTDVIEIVGWPARTE